MTLLELKCNVVTQKVCDSTHTYIALQTLGGVSLWGEAVVLVGTLSTPGLAGHTQNGDGGWTPVCVSISNLTV